MSRRTRTHREVERTLEVTEDHAVPDLAGLPGVARVAGPVTHSLAAVYHDTDGLDLVRHRTTLRRRTGGQDEGWHLKRPSTDGERDELHAPLGSRPSPAPVALRRAVAALARGADLGPVVELATERTVHRLEADDGTVLAELCDDRVRAHVLLTGHEHGWREWEVELVTGGTDLLRAAVDALTAAGARPAAVTSKLARALGDAVPPTPDGPRRTRPRDPATALAAAAVAGVRDDLVRLDPAVRADADDAVHRARVATRRGRELLAALRPVLDRAATDPVRAELAWLGGALGTVREVEVARAGLDALLAAHPDLAPAGLASRLRRDLDRERRTGHRALLGSLDAGRYQGLLRALDELVADPPATEDGPGRADRAARQVLGAQWRRVRRAHRALRRAEPGEAPERAHDLRKAAKRLRYTAEASTDVLGSRAARLGRRAKDLQDALGHGQDADALRGVLAAAAVDASGPDGFALGRLHAAAGAAEAPDAVHRAWRRLRSDRATGWLR